MARNVLRWGQSAYESDLDLGRERAGAEALGMGWRSVSEAVKATDLQGVDALVVTSRVRVDDAVLGRFEGSLVLTTTSGTDHIDLVAARDRGVVVGRCPMARRDSVVEHALVSIMGLLRRQPSLHRAARAGRWARRDLPALAPIGLRGSPVLVVGLGIIGRRMAEVLAALGAEVWGLDPAGVPDSVRSVELDEALPLAAAVTVHCALTPQTRGLFSAARIGSMSEDSVLVNTARGPIVDVVAAVEAVRTGRMRGASLDVFAEEPWPALQQAAQVDGVWLTPHASGYDRGLGERVATEVVDALAAWSSGRPIPHAVEVL